MAANIMITASRLCLRNQVTLRSCGRSICSAVSTKVSQSGPASSTHCHDITSQQHLHSIVFASASRFHTASRRYDVTTVNCPAFAESVTEGDIRWAKKVGDFVALDETIGEVETDKTSIAVIASVAGTIQEILVEDGSTIGPGTPLITIAPGEAGAAPAASADPSEAPKPAAAEPKTETPSPAAAPTPVPTSMPSPPPLPTEPLTSTPTSQVLPSSPSATVGESAGPSRTEERVKMTRMRLRIAQRLKDAQNTCAMLTTFNEIDMGGIMELRTKYKDAFVKKHGMKLGFMSAFMKASAHALQNEPAVNAVIDGADIVYRDYVDISVAVSTPKGLVVPVVRNVETMNYFQIEKAIEELGNKAKDGNLAVEDMDGGTFTISNGGVFGSLMGTPIINPPQSAILGMHGIFDRPVAINGKVEIRPMMYIALTYDHRLVDGREAVTFLRKVKSSVEDPRVLLLDL